MSTSTLLKSLFEYKAWANRELFAELETKLDGTQHPEAFRLCLRLLNHIYVVDQIFAAHLSGKPHGYAATNTPETPSLSELREAVASCDAWYLSHIASLSETQFEESLSFAFTDGERGRMSREEILAHIITHGAYHRGAVGRVMAQLDVTPPRDILTRYLHQVEPERRAL